MRFTWNVPANPMTNNVRQMSSVRRGTGYSSPTATASTRTLSSFEVALIQETPDKTTEPFRSGLAF